ncbi:MAG: carboxymethylenebutenolidase [Acidobacteria bacterium]|nr:MAG: carboxymethylenebutenolidase [Acidobacteriota bacterium]
MKKLFIALLLLVAVSAPAQDWAKQRLAASTRHREWVNVKNGVRTVSAFVVYPEVKGKAPAVVVIHEIFGMTDWVQLLADELAETGVIAIAPDLLSGMGAIADVGKAIRDLPPDQITGDLNAVADYVSKFPAANGKVAVAGFCWGGTQSFRGPDVVDTIKAPVYGFYAGNDARIGATVPKTQELMRAASKTYEIVTYDGAGHGFMRAGEAPDASEANKKARDEAWTRWKSLLKKLQ